MHGPGREDTPSSLAANCSTCPLYTRTALTTPAEAHMQGPVLVLTLTWALALAATAYMALCEL